MRQLSFGERANEILVSRSTYFIIIRSTEFKKFRFARRLKQVWKEIYCSYILNEM